MTYFNERKFSTLKFITREDINTTDLVISLANSKQNQQTQGNIIIPVYTHKLKTGRYTHPVSLARHPNANNKPMLEPKLVCTVGWWWCMMVHFHAAMHKQTTSSVEKFTVIHLPVFYKYHRIRVRHYARLVVVVYLYG